MVNWMKTLGMALGMVLGLVLGPNLAFAQIGSPLFGQDQSGTCRNVYVRDLSNGSWLSQGCINTTTHVWVPSGAVIGPTTSVVGDLPVFGNTTGTLLTDTGISFPGSIGANQLLYAPTSASLAGLSTLANAVLVTNGSGVPSLSTTVGGNLTYSGTSTYSGLTAFGGGVYAKVRVVTAAGNVTISGTDNLVVVNKTSAEATVVNYTCPAVVGSSGFTFTLKDGAGVDATFNITLTPSSGTIDGAATFIMNTSTAGVPPYDSRSVVCDGAGNSWID